MTEAGAGTPRVSVVVETDNGGDLAAVLAAVLPQLARGDEVVVTFATVEPPRLPSWKQGNPIHLIRIPATAGYYEHKRAGFRAARGDLVAFLDADCTPHATWLAELTRPFAAGARVVAGHTSYPGALAPIANRMDFPYFTGNFFANNVAFARAVFAAHPYPVTPPSMQKGACQLLALELAAAGIPVTYAPDATIEHAWPASLREWLEVRLRRGADTRALLPHFAGSLAPIVARLGALPALALLAARGAIGTGRALRRGPRVRGLGLVATVTVLDAIGAVTA